jgi:hypothetical protein
MSDHPLTRFAILQFLERLQPLARVLALPLFHHSFRFPEFDLFFVHLHL